MNGRQKTVIASYRKYGVKPLFQPGFFWGDYGVYKGCLRLKKQNKEVKIWLIVSLLVPYLIICFLHDGS